MAAHKRWRSRSRTATRTFRSTSLCTASPRLNPQKDGDVKPLASEGLFSVRSAYPKVVAGNSCVPSQVTPIASLRTLDRCYQMDLTSEKAQAATRVALTL